MRKKHRRTGEELRAIFEIVNRAEYKKHIKETVKELIGRYAPKIIDPSMIMFDSFTGLYFRSSRDVLTNAFEEFRKRVGIEHNLMKLPWEEETVKKEILSKQEMIQKIIRQKRQFGWNSVVPNSVKGVTFHQGVRPDTMIYR